MGLEDPPCTIAFSPILHSTDFAGGFFGGHEYWKVIAGVSVCIVSMRVKSACANLILVCIFSFFIFVFGLISANHFPDKRASVKLAR